MTIANVSRESVRGLPAALIVAQEAINLPEIEAMLRRLAEFELGIFMPHMHDEQSGDFQRLRDGLVQVESGLEVSFQPLQGISSQKDRFLPVGWVWRAGAPTPAVVCEMVFQAGPDDEEPVTKHKMKRGS